MSLYHIFVYVPVVSCEAVKEAMFQAGAGQVGNYRCCAWEVLGAGQFLAEPGSTPYVGAVGVLEKVKEYQVNMVCSEENITAVIAAMKRVHPYEAPAYGVIKLEDF